MYIKLDIYVGMMKFLFLLIQMYVIFLFQVGSLR